MKWQGIRRDALDVTTSLGHGLLEINGRHAIDGELRRRRGMSRSSLPQKPSAIRGLVGFSNAQSSVNACVLDGPRLQGYTQPYALWGDNPDNTGSEELSEWVSFAQVSVSADEYRSNGPRYTQMSTVTPL